MANNQTGLCRLWQKRLWQNIEIRLINPTKYKVYFNSNSKQIQMKKIKTIMINSLLIMSMLITIKLSYEYIYS